MVSVSSVAVTPLALTVMFAPPAAGATMASPFDVAAQSFVQTPE